MNVSFESHLRSQILNCLGVGAPEVAQSQVDGDGCLLSADGLRRYGNCLIATENPDADLRPKSPCAAADLHGELDDQEEMLRASAAVQGLPQLTICRWPAGASFALFLSHDIDQVYDRELFRILADVNHVRRRVLSGEPGNTGLACRRIARAMFTPKRALLDFETILDLEQRRGFHSTFFVLHDRYWARQGARFSLKQPEIQDIGRLILRAGCELGVHGGFYRFNRPDLYRESREAIARVFGIEPAGIRNHILRFSYPETWRAQAEAGFTYDSTYGFRTVPGPRAGLALPFVPYDVSRGEALPIIELPLAIMDTSIFRYFRLQSGAALDFTWELASKLASRGALLSLLWHNNYFNEPEYSDWQMVYQTLLERLAALRPWCATGAQIAQWWGNRARVSVSCQRQGSSVCWRLDAPDAVQDLSLRLGPKSLLANLAVAGPAASIRESDDQFLVTFPKLAQSESCELRADLCPAR